MWAINWKNSLGEKKRQSFSLLQSLKFICKKLVFLIAYLSLSATVAGYFFFFFAFRESSLPETPAAEQMMGERQRKAYKCSCKLAFLMKACKGWFEQNWWLWHAFLEETCPRSPPCRCSCSSAWCGGPAAPSSGLVAGVPWYMGAFAFVLSDLGLGVRASCGCCNACCLVFCFGEKTLWTVC